MRIQPNGDAFGAVAEQSRAPASRGKKELPEFWLLFLLSTDSRTSVWSSIVF